MLDERILAQMLYEAAELGAEAALVKLGKIPEEINERTAF
jgi:hypothetical protein